MITAQETSPRWINLLVGLWLFLSAFLWPHARAQFADTLVVGAGAAIAAGLALRVPQLRYVNAVLAIWLFLMTWVLPFARVATLWNDALTAIVMLAIAMVPSRRQAACR